jgi:hypothetical protein
MPEPIFIYESPDGQKVQVPYSGVSEFETANKGIKFKKYHAYEAIEADESGKKEKFIVPFEGSREFWEANKGKVLPYQQESKPTKPTKLSTFAPQRTEFVTPTRPEEVPVEVKQQQTEQQAQQAFDASFNKGVKPMPKAQQAEMDKAVSAPPQATESENIYKGIQTPNGGIIAFDQEQELPYFESKQGQRTYFKSAKEVQDFAPAGLTDFFTSQYIDLMNKKESEKEIRHFRDQVVPQVEQGEGYTPDVDTQKALTEQRKQRDIQYFLEESSEKYNIHKGDAYQNLARYAPELNKSIQYYGSFADNGDVFSLSDQQILDIQKKDAMEGKPVVRSPKLLQDYADISRGRVREDI